MTLENAVAGVGHNMPPDDIILAAERLKAFIERIERLNEEKAALQADIKEVFAEAKGTGFDPTIMRLLIRLRAQDQDAADERELLLAVYKRALGMTP